MLALAHGSKGIMFWKFATNDNPANMLVCGDIYFKALAVTHKKDMHFTFQVK
jgi:hypothetical protein